MVNRRFIDLNSKFIEIGLPPCLGKEPHDEFWQTIFAQLMDFIPPLTSFVVAWNATTAITKSKVFPVGISF
jgi:hypothetical protein